MNDESTPEAVAWAAKLEGMRRGVGLRLDREGRWWQGDEPFTHGGLVDALNRGIRLHPETGEPIVYIGDKWCYFESAEVPFIVHSIRYQETALWAELNTGERLVVPRDGFVSRGDRVFITFGDGRTARLDRKTQGRLADALSETDGRLALEFGGARWLIRQAATST